MFFLSVQDFHNALTVVGSTVRSLILHLSVREAHSQSKLYYQHSWGDHLTPPLPRLFTLTISLVYSLVQKTVKTTFQVYREYITGSHAYKSTHYELWNVIQCVLPSVVWSSGEIMPFSQPQLNFLLTCVFLEWTNKETIQMNLLTKQKETHRLRKQTYGCWGWRDS